jgi:hypothetical protein
MTDFLKRGGIDFKMKALFNIYVKLLEIFKVNKESILSRIPSELKALFYNNRLKTLSIFF